MAKKANIVERGIFLPDAVKEEMAQLIADNVELIDTINPMLEDGEEADDVVEALVPLLDAIEGTLERAYQANKKALKIGVAKKVELRKAETDDEG